MRPFFAQRCRRRSAMQRRADRRADRSAHSIVRDNVLTHSDLNGIRVQSVTVTGNRADDNANYGIRVEHGPPITVTDWTRMPFRSLWVRTLSRTMLCADR